jgi:hypothetical protein
LVEACCLPQQIGRCPCDIKQYKKSGHPNPPDALKQACLERERGAFVPPVSIWKYGRDTHRLAKSPLAADARITAPMDKAASGLEAHPHVSSFVEMAPFGPKLLVLAFLACALLGDESETIIANRL